jgi:ribonuclease H / adenosylcobalamin/alpha-ribazole phosphatase
MSTTVHVVRHGRTALNATGRFRGLADPPLDEVGLDEAERAAERLAGLPLVAVATSPLRRAVQTAAAVAGPHRLTPVPIDGLLDLDHGSWTGLIPAEAEALDPEAYRRFREDPRACTPPGGERLAAVEQRVDALLDALAAGHAGEEIAVVSHEIPIRLLWSGLMRVDGPAMWDLILPTAGVLTIRLHDGVWEVVATPG